MGKINILSMCCALFLLIGCTNHAEAQEFKDKQTKELNFTSDIKVFVIKNIFGDVNVEGGTTNKGQLDIEQTISADTDADLEEAKKEIEVRIKRFGDTLLVYIYSPDIELRTRKGHFDYHMHHYDKDYEFRFDFSAKVPKNIEVIAETINDGDVYVNNIEGKLKVHNVNGSIKVENVKDVSDAVTVNGEVEVNFSQNPTRNCRFKTINGDIKVLCKKGLSADINYKSMNGEFYTNYEVKTIESEVTKEKKKKGKTTYFKLGNKPQFRVGEGKIKMTFETLNGDMIVKYL
jgi:cytoskeletal protein CcmA (bactofilin family)